MPVTHTYDADGNRILMKASGTLTVPQLERYLGEVLANQEIREGFVEFVDLTEVEDLVFKFSETAVFEPIWRNYMAKGVKRTIVLAPTDVAYGIFRMLITSLKAATGEEDIPFYVYRYRESAMKALDGAVDETV